MSRDACEHCGKAVGFLDRFKTNYDKKPMLPCPGCGAELIATSRLLGHSSLTAIVFLFSWYVAGMATNGIAEFAVAVGVPTFYFVVLFPLRTR